VLELAWQQVAVFSRLDIVGTGMEGDAKAAAFSPLIPMGEDFAYH
jgi:hypothetical protein